MEVKRPIIATEVRGKLRKTRKKKTSREIGSGRRGASQERSKKRKIKLETERPRNWRNLLTRVIQIKPKKEIRRHRITENINEKRKKERE